MLKKLLVISLLCIGVLALVVPQTTAKTCVAYYRGACVAWTGSLICQIGATGLGNCEGVQLQCVADGSSYAVVCGNPGTNTWCAPGVNVAYYGGSITATYDIDPGDCDDSGKALVTATAKPSQDLLDALSAAGACPNDGWTVVDAVPCTMTLVDQQKDACGNVVSDAVFSCELPDCETLAYDCENGKFESRQYNCNLIDTNDYKVPKCP